MKHSYAFSRQLNVLIEIVLEYSISAFLCEKFQI